MVFVIGLPIFFAELFVGQYGGLGPIKAYTRLAPFFQGEYYHKICGMNENMEHVYGVWCMCREAGVCAANADGVHII